jgi:hypothetical protein
MGPLRPRKPPIKFLYLSIRFEYRSLGTSDLADTTLFSFNKVYLDALKKLNLSPRDWPDTSNAAPDGDIKTVVKKEEDTEGTQDLATADDSEIKKKGQPTIIKKENDIKPEQDVKVKTEPGYDDVQINKQEEDDEVSFVESRPAKRARRRK